MLFRSRTSRGLSQARLAALAGVTEMTVSNLERNRNDATCGTMEKLTVALQIQVSPPAFPPPEPEESDLGAFPCPQCGAENVGTEPSSGLEEGSLVVCYECDHEGPTEDTDALAVVAWNALALGKTWMGAR